MPYLFSNAKKRSMEVQNSVGDDTTPCLTQLEVEKYSELQVFHETLTYCLVPDCVSASNRHPSYPIQSYLVR